MFFNFFKPKKSLMVGQYIVEHIKNTDRKVITPMKLNKLVYLAHSYMLILLDEPLLDEPILAWQNGPFIQELYKKVRNFKDKPVTKIINKKFINLSPDEISVIKHVISVYNGYSAIELSNLTQNIPSPWSYIWFSNGSNTIIPDVLIYEHYKAMFKIEEIRNKAKNGTL